MQPGPGGAQCALHAGVSANFVCARCGNFMCAACAVNGAETQCPTCRQLNPVGFPYDANADLGTLWSHATEGFQREMAMCIVAGLIFLAFAVGGGMVANVIVGIVDAIIGVEIDPANPFRNLRGFGINILITQVIQQVVNFAVQGIALVGIYRLLMDVLVGKKADLARMFSQLHLLPHFIVLHIIMFFVFTLPSLIYFSIVGFVGMRLIGLDWNRLSDFRVERLANPALLGLLFGSFVLFTAVMIIILPMSLFATPELIVGQCGPVEALKRAWDLGDGQRLRVFGYGFVAFVVYMAGALACGVGIIVSLPVAFMLVLSLFLALRRSSSLPPAIHT